MDVFAMIFIPIGLAMDSFAVSIAAGTILKKFKFSRAAYIALFMGAFQSVMFMSGYLVGYGFKNIISEWDHWIVFGVLSFLGGKMLYEGAKHETHKIFNPLNTWVLVGLAFATSIDASAVGIGMAFLDFVLWMPMASIGLTAFLFSFGGVYLGTNVKASSKLRVEYLGGLILIAIGIKELLSHLLSETHLLD